jgi:hypothetical protein
MTKAQELAARLRQRLEKGDLGIPTQVSGPVVQQVAAKRDKEGMTHFSWDAETRRMIEWLKTWQPQDSSFTLLANELGQSVVTVEDVAAFRRSLLLDVADGPGGPRSRTGALQSDVARLFNMFVGTT